ncbi:MAG: bile acid:sodium symporter family protein [Bacillus sp. (in: Bacteria)]|nr:bile acid:sodium symporter family protein [Bacillus sp. (in: firmicutes)]
MVKKWSQWIGQTFAFWVLLFSVIAFLFPKGFTWIAPYIVPMLGVIMFGMGLTLKWDDFKEVFTRPKEVFIGVGAQFLIMPLLAVGLVTIFPVSPEVALGVILVGCCPGGTASNVITYLAKGDTALSVTITSVSTLLAPFVTPFLIWLFAEEWLTISATSLVWSIMKMVILPIALGLIVRSLFPKHVEASIDVLPMISVISIVAIIGAIIAVNKEALASSGVLIFTIVMLHNVLGLLIGWLLAKWLKLSLPKQAAISIEVGMQNSGLGAALAAAHFAPLAAVPSAIFSVWHNISGPLFATMFRKQMAATTVKEDIHTVVN